MLVRVLDVLDVLVIMGRMRMDVRFAAVLVLVLVDVGRPVGMFVAHFAPVISCTGPGISDAPLRRWCMSNRSERHGQEPPPRCSRHGERRRDPRQCTSRGRRVEAT